MPSSSPWSETQPALASTPEKNRRVLVVDDHEAIHADFRKILGAEAGDTDFDAEEAAVFGGGGPSAGHAGFELSFATQGTAALAQVQAAAAEGRRFAMVFMDMRMPPGWDGLETTARLWAVDADLQVVICTAYSDKSWAEMMAQVSHPERLLILKKPFDSVEVLQLAHALTEKWALLQSSRQNLRDLERTVGQRTRELCETNARLEAEIARHQASAARVREQAALLDKAQDAIFVTDLDDCIRYWNRGAARLYGWTSEQLLGQAAGPALGEAPAATAAARRTVLATGEWQGNLTQRTAAGREITVQSRWTLVRDEADRPHAILIINTDLTEQRRLEACLRHTQRLESLGTLAGGIAHDLNNALQPVALSLDIFQRQLTDPRHRGLLDLIGTSLGRASGLVRQIRSFARGVEGARLPLDPSQLLDGIAVIVRQTFPKNITLRLTAPHAACPVLGDATQLHQALLDLCLNARDAMPAGGTLTLALDHATTLPPTVPPGRYVVFTVSDTGTGIPAGLQPRVFDPFFTTKAPGQGSGLGLATAESTIRSHGGSLHFTSQEGEGTSFRIFLPAAPDEPAAPAAPPPAPAPALAPAPTRGQGELILLVDDEAPILRVLSLTLEACGYRTVRAADGAAALRAYHEHPAALRAVITDMVMPVMDGPALIGALKELDPALPVIATTGMASEESLAAVTHLGVAHILPKPCSAQAVLQVLRAVLGGG